MWAVDLRVCACHSSSLGSSVFISDLGYQTHPHPGIWVPDKKGSRLALRLGVMTGLFLCIFNIFLWIFNPPLRGKTLVSTQVQDILDFSLRGAGQFLSASILRFWGQGAVQQQCRCHMLICLMSLSLQKAASESKCETELWFHGFSRIGLRCRCERAAKQAW